jgi:hypothetical protein
VYFVLDVCACAKKETVHSSLINLEVIENVNKFDLHSNFIILDRKVV